MSTPRIVTFGELLLRLSPPGQEALLESGLLRANWGGAEANLAVALAHLGVAATYVTALPHNPLALRAQAALRAEGVQLHAAEIADSRLGLFFVDLGTDSRPANTTYDRGGSAFAQVSGTSFDWPGILAGAAWFHGTGITPALGSGPLEALGRAMETARKLAVPVSLDLNYRPPLWAGRDPTPLIAPISRGVDLLIANSSSLPAMLGLDTDDPRVVAERTGARRVVLTRREVLAGNTHRWSATLYDSMSRGLAASKVYQVRAVDRVGAGDCFAAALIFCLIEDRPLEQALEFAVVAAAHKLRVPGDWSRLTPEQVERLLAAPDPAWS
jgi:2-dehydro-3-deoxygluconokinase